MGDLVKRAQLMAVIGHDAIGQKRKFTDQPYHSHCEKVADLVALHTDDEDIIAAGWVHDLVEDTAITLPHITTYLGVIVGALVKGVTKEKPYGDDAEKNLLHEIGRFLDAEEDVCLLKLCDIRANVADMSTTTDYAFIEAWLPKKIAMVLAIRMATVEYAAFCDAVLQFIRTQARLHFPCSHTGKLYLHGQALLEEAITFKQTKETAGV